MTDGPSFYNFALARTARISAALGALGGLALLTWTLLEEHMFAEDWATWLWIAITALLVTALGGYLGLILLWPILGPIAGGLQGGPFGVGDAVWILRGKYKGTKATVYEVWAERGQVRVDLGPEAQQRFEDVFCIVAVCR